MKDKPKLVVPQPRPPSKVELLMMRLQDEVLFFRRVVFALVKRAGSVELEPNEGLANPSESIDVAVNNETGAVRLTYLLASPICAPNGAPIMTPAGQETKSSDGAEDKLDTLRTPATQETGCCCGGPGNCDSCKE